MNYNVLFKILSFNEYYSLKRSIKSTLMVCSKPGKNKPCLLVLVLGENLKVNHFLLGPI